MFRIKLKLLIGLFCCLQIRRVWEVELSAVLDIAKTGHRKRILHSLSGTQSPPGPNMDEIAQELSQMVIMYNDYL